MLSFSVVLLVLVALIAANLPWLSDRVFIFMSTPPLGKRVWIRWAEWLSYYFLVGFMAVGLEFKATGERHAQGWEFYVVTLCLFLVFALPGFVFRYNVKQLLVQRKK